MEGSTEELFGIFKLKKSIFCCIYTLISIYISIIENIYINSIYFAAITYETTLTELIHSNQKHIDVVPTRTALSGLDFNNLCRRQGPAVFHFLGKQDSPSTSTSTSTSCTTRAAEVRHCHTT